MTRLTDRPAEKYTPLDVPAEWTAQYTKELQDEAKAIIEWLNEHKKTIAWLAQASGVPRGTLYIVIPGKYNSKGLARMLKQCSDTIRHLNERRSVKEAPFIESSVSKVVFAACTRARQYRSFAVIPAAVGTGKTRALQEYMRDNTNTILVEADPAMTARSLVDELTAMLKIDVPKNQATHEKKYKRIIETLKDLDALLILDEAETVNDSTLHHIRRIRDKAQIGVVLSGTAKLYSLISPRGGQFDQIRSRVCYWPKPIHGITRQDMDAVAVAAFVDLGEDAVDKATLAALWHHTKGSMRMLVEDLIPAIRDYGLPKHPLSADLVHAVATDVLSLDR